MSSPADTSRFRELEEGLWRNGSDWRDQMLTANFREFCRFGNVYDRDHLLSSSSAGVEVEFPFENFAAEWLADSVVLVTYENVVHRNGGTERARRSSIWVEEDNEWRLRFMQATTLEE